MPDLRCNEGGRPLQTCNAKMEQIAPVEMKITAHYKNSRANEALARDGAAFRG
jgi:hypothetical protein